MHPLIHRARICDRRSEERGRGLKCAFTLIEILIVVAIIGILATIVFAKFSSMLNYGKAESMSVSVTHIRELIELKAATRDGAIAPSGFPAQINPAWFQLNRLPYHTWTNDPMIIDTVAGAADEIYPAVKTFDPDVVGASNTWYNTTNGHFCVRVVDEGDDDDTLDSFNTANNTSATSLDQTTP